MHPATQSNIGTPFKDWAPGLLIASVIGLVYFAVRPPLLDLDGYGYRLAMLGPDRLENMDHLHVLWEPLQILMLAIARSLGDTSTAPFQIFGIAVNCVTLFFFWELLRKVSHSRLFASTATIFVAFSPRFWYLGFQNEPYPLLFLAVVLYLTAWHTADGDPPSGLRLIAAAICLAAAILVHQAAAFLVPAGVLALMIFGSKLPRNRLIRAILWGTSIVAIVVPVYLSSGGYAVANLPIFRWIARRFEEPALCRNCKLLSHFLYKR